MAQQTINVGTADKGNGDPLRTAFIKVNNNFNELYSSLGADFENLETNLIPKDDDTYDLGSPTKKWRSLYVGGNTIYLDNTPLTVEGGVLKVNGSNVGGSSAWNDVTGKPTFSAVATTGSYSDLSNKPTIPSTIESLSNVTLTTPTLGQVLKYDGANWINGTDTANLGDITINGSQISATTGVIEVKGSIYAQLTGGSDENRFFVNDNVGARITTSSVGHDWTFNPQGNLILPAKFPIQFTAVFDAAHYTGLAAFQGDGTASFIVGLNRQGAQLSWTADDPTFNTNKGYVGQQNFRYTEADHGITGFNVDILMEMMGPDPNSGEYNLQVSFTQVPSIMQLAKVRSTDEMIVSAAASAWLFASEGDLYLPPNGTIRDHGGNSVIFSNGEVLTAVGTDISLLSGDDIWIQGKDLPGTDSEGGDVYIRGGTGDPGNSGGDIQILAGAAGALDGAGDTGNSGGDISIGGGQGMGYSNRGGNVTLQAGPGEYNQGGALTIQSGPGGVAGFKLYQGPVSFIDNTNPVRVAFAAAHNLNTGDAIYLTGITTATELNNRKFYVVDSSSTEVDLYYDRDINTAVDGTGMTSWASTVTTAINNNLVSTSTFAGDSSVDPNIANVVVGDYVYGGSLPGKKAVTAIQFIAPVTYNIDIDGTDGSVFDTGVIYTFKRADGGGIADSTAHGGDISINAGTAANNNSGDSGSINFSSGDLSWKFKYDGNTLFPILNVPISDNANPSGTGQTLKFDNSAYQAIIYGPSASVTNTSAERIIIQGAPGYTGTTGEGGDIYLWAGPGGSAGGDGGDIKIRAGRGTTTGGGGYLNFQAGNSVDGNGGYIRIESGSSSNGTGGNITIDANSGGHLDLYTAAAGVIRLNTAGGNYVWTFTDTGNLQVPNGTTIIHDGFTIGSEGSYAFVDIPNNANTNLNDGLRIANQNGPVSITSFLQSPGTVRTWTFNPQGDLELPGGGSLATAGYDVGLLAGNDGNSTFGSVTINTQFPAATYTVTQEGGFVAGPGANTITGNTSNSPSANFIVAGMTVTGLNLIGVTTVTSATVDMSGNFTIITDADEVDPFAFNEVYTFTGAEPQDRNWEFNSLGELNLPQGGVIQETTVTNELWGTTTTSLTLVPGGAANGTQRLEIYSTGAGEGDHIHITSGDQAQTDLFLGNDTQYFAVAASGENRIQARDGTNSPSPGTSAGSGANINIYAGNAGDNGGNVADGASGGDVFLQSGISTSGLGGSIYLASSSGPDGFGFIRISTDGGGTNWTFNEANELVFPDATVQTTAYTGLQTSLVGAVDNNVLIRTSETVVTNNLYTNTVDFSTDVDIGGGTIISGWIQRNSEQIEISLFGPGAFRTYLTGLSLGRTVTVTYSTGSGNQTLTRPLTQIFANVAQEDPSNPGWYRVAGRIDATLPVGQTGIVSINFPVTTTPQRDWTFSDTGSLTFPDASVQTTAYTGTANLATVARNIENEGDVSIRVNLTDSTTRIWRFGEDGDFTIPGNLIYGGDTIHAKESTSTAGNPLTVRAGDSETQVGGNLILRGGDTIGSVGTPRNSGWAVLRAGSTVTGNGGYAELLGGNTTAGTGGQAYVTAGSTTTGNGGPVEITAGDTVTGDGGSVTIESGEAVTGTAGNINITAKGTVTGDGGNVNLNGGSATSGNGGAINLTAGDTIGSGDPGTIRLRTFNAAAPQDWTFNFNGTLTFPDTTVQSTAWTKSAAAVQSSAPGSPVTGQLWYDTDDGNTYIWTGSAWVDSNPAAAAPTVDITDTNGLTTTYYPTFVESRTSGQYVRADVDLTYRTDNNTLTAGNLTTGILRIEDGAHEKFQTKADATGVVAHDCSSGHVFYHTSPDANWTVNLTNLNLSSGYATAVTLVIVQGGTGYYPSAVQIGGVGQTLNWQGNTTPTPSTNRTDVVTFSIINNSGTYTVLGQLTGF